MNSTFNTKSNKWNQSLTFKTNNSLYTIIILQPDIVHITGTPNRTRGQCSPFRVHLFFTPSCILFSQHIYDHMCVFVCLCVRKIGRKIVETDVQLMGHQVLLPSNPRCSKIDACIQQIMDLDGAHTGRQVSLLPVRARRPTSQTLRERSFDG